MSFKDDVESLFEGLIEFISVTEDVQLITPRVSIITPDREIALNATICEIAARNCYKSETRLGSSPHFLKTLVCKRGHESIIEHRAITTRFVVSRATSHQLVRHRLAAYSQESQRYCDYGGALRLIVPFELCKNSEAMQIWLNSCLESYSNYKKLRLLKSKPEDSRGVLPQDVATEVIATFNLRVWRHFFIERGLNKRAQWPIRSCALSLLKAFSSKMPSLFGDLQDAALPSVGYARLVEDPFYPYLQGK